MTTRPERHRWHRRAVLSRHLGPTTILLAPEGEHEPVTLNHSGRRLWEALAAPRTAAELAAMLGPSARPDVDHWLAAMAGAELVSTTGGPPTSAASPRPLEPTLRQPAARLARALRSSPDGERLGPRLLWTTLVEEAIVADDDASAPDPDELHGGLARMLVVERGALDALRALDDCGIGAVALKGLATAHLDYSRPELRTFADADLLVPEDDFPAALHALAGIGFGSTFELDRSARTTKAVTLRGPHDVVVDLHQRLVRGTYGYLADTTDQVGEPDRFDLGGFEVTALSPAARFVHAALHARLTAVAPHTLLDLLVLGHSVPVEDLERQARAWHAMTICTQAADQVAALTGYRPVPDWTGEAGRRDRWLAGGNYGVVRREVAALAAIGRPGPAIRYAAAKVAPGVRYRADRGRSRWGHLRQGISP